MENAHKFYINGEWVEPIAAKPLDVIDPSTEEAYATISLGSSADTDSAVEAAKNAFKTWSQSSKDERLNLLQQICDLYEARLDAMGAIISQEMGAPKNLAINAQAGSGLSHIKAFIRTLKNFEFERPLGHDGTAQILMEPIGVCGLITPWNWPMNQIALKVIPAIAAGCTMVLKPSEIAPMSALYFAQILHDAGVPKGVFNLVNGDGPGVGTDLSGHPDVSMISFTGSTRAGSLISKNSADSVKRVSLELGGKGANIIFADADEKAVTRGLRHCFQNTGQSCNAPTRMLVEKSRYQQAVEEAKSVAENTHVDQANMEGNHIGPLVSQMQFDKVQALIEAAINEDSATLIAGGLGRPDGLNRGYFVRPTVFADCNNQMRIMREEVFGPVLSIMAFEDEDEAIEIANDSDYGLTHYLQTQDSEKARRVARQLRAGMVEINGNSLPSGSPFGGYKQSGNGREGGEWGLEDFLEVKAVSTI